MLHNKQENRIECPDGLVFFPERGFGLDTKIFKQIACKEILDSRCHNCGKFEDITKCKKRDLFLTIVKDE